MKQRIRYGMVGGGEGAFIGAVHRHAAQLDGEYELVCGAFSSNAAKSLSSGAALGLTQQRCYANWEAMYAAEASLPLAERMQCVVIVTPNQLHFAPAEAALRHGFHVLSDKPATFTLAESQRLASTLEETGLLYGLTHTYTGYPAIVEAKDRIAKGELGTIRKIIVEYIQGWLAEPVEQQGNQQAAWRLDPERAGISCCMGDIGVHAFNLAEFVSGLEVTRLSAELSSIVAGRQLDDDGTVLMHFNNGAKGTLLASQICLGDENAFTLRIYGDKAAFEWQQMEPNTLWLKFPNQATQMLRVGTAAMGSLAASQTRVPGGHPEGYIEAFANLYTLFAKQIRDAESGVSNLMPSPGIQAALRGMAFIETAVKSSQENNAWLTLKTTS